MSIKEIVESKISHKIKQKKKSNLSDRLLWIGKKVI